jgi:hypothetical protein
MSEFEVAAEPFEYSWRPYGRLSQGGREAAQGKDAGAGLHFERRVFVPPGGGFARVVDVIDNPTANR